MTRRFADLPAPRLAGLLSDRSILVQPIGAIEQHGPHLPLSTDVLVPEAIGAAAVDRATAEGVDAWLLPTLAVSKSDEHAWAPGTLWLSADTLLAVLRDLGRSIAATAARKVVFLNGHGGNTALLQVANRELRRLYDLQPFTMPAGVQRAGSGQDGEPDELGFGIHAGWSETAVIMHLAPELVDQEAFSRSVPDQLAGFELIGFNGTPVTFGWLSDDFAASGVIGDPTGATAAAGAVLFDAGVDFAVKALHEIDRFPPPIPVTGSERAMRAMLDVWLPPNDALDRPQMQVATVDETGSPDARTVLLSEWDDDGFVFHTDATSRKADQLRRIPAVALVVLWPGFTRQLVVQGVAEVADRDRLDRAYARRSPYLQQLAWQNTMAVAQLEPAERADTWRRFADEHAGSELEAPATWIGYLVRPHRVTFWQSDPEGPSHRVEFRRSAHGEWTEHHLPG